MRRSANTPSPCTATPRNCASSPAAKPGLMWGEELQPARVRRVSRQWREQAPSRARQHATELQTRKVSAYDRDVRAFELAPQGFARSGPQSRVHVRQCMEIRLLQLERALHGIAEEHGAS